MKNFIKQIFGSGSESKSNLIKSWVEELEGLDDTSALQFATQHLTQLNNPVEGAEKFSLQNQYDFIILLEALNQSRLEKLSAQFSSLENMKSELENSLVETGYSYCRQAFIFQLKVIEQYVEQTKNLQQQVAIQPDQLALLLARTLNSAFNMIKWRLFSQANPPTKVWLQINVLYRLAAQKVLLNNTLELFNLSASTSLSAFFVQIYMLGQLAQASMQKYHLEIASRVINTLLTRARISDKLTSEQYLFFVDLQKDLPAKRMRDVQLSDSCRCWELDELEKQITVAITVSDRGEIPQNLALAKISPPKKLNETLRILLDEWKKTGYVRQRRKFEREASSKTGKVKSGIAEICNQVKQANQLEGSLHQSTLLDERLRLHTTLKTTSLLTATSGTLDTWMITDESPNGLGARVNKYANILPRPNKLIGLVIDGEMSKIVLGMIRSVKPTQGNQLRVGVEVLSNYPKWVQLKRTDKNETFPNSQLETNLPEYLSSNKPSSLDINLFAGIYLPIEAGLSDTSQLILPKMNYRANANYNITVSGIQQHVLLGEPNESHDDWVKVAFPF